MEMLWLQGACVALLLTGATSLYAQDNIAVAGNSASEVIGEAVAASVALNIEVINVKSDVGSLYVSVYDSKDTFLGDDYFQHKVIKVADHLQQERIVFDLLLPVGEYAIAIHHDDNDNKKMDTNFIGIPKEPVAMSNNHIPRFGPPKYTEAKFQLEKTAQSMQFKL